MTFISPTKNLDCRIMLSSNMPRIDGSSRNSLAKNVSYSTTSGVMAPLKEPWRKQAHKQPHRMRQQRTTVKERKKQTKKKKSFSNYLYRGAFNHNLERRMYILRRILFTL